MIAEYSFLPWLRRGLANQIAAPAHGTSRAKVSVTVSVASDATPPIAAAPKTIELLGPGDVVGINPHVVVRTEPRNWITDFEPNYLAFVEFYDEDFAWRFTPAQVDAQQHRLPPWICLLVLKEGEFVRDRRPGRPLPSVRLTTVTADDVLPDPDQTWAWAHVHLNLPLGAGETPNVEQLDALLSNDPDKGYCRLVSPRHLAPDSAYTAFVIPTFDIGRLAGLGETPADSEDGLAVAWARGAKEFPIYYEWSFRTGRRGDFEELVTALKPRPIDKRVGVRDLDVRRPGFDLVVNAATDLVGLEGAVRTARTEERRLSTASDFPTKIEEKINFPTEAVTTGLADEDGDPVITVPLYGRWHAMVNKIAATPSATNWVDGLNADPRHRSAAGMGTLVVQKHQEEYMRQAWQQIGDVVAANRVIRNTQAAMLTAHALYAKSLVPLPEVRLLPIIAPVMSKIMGSPVTVRHLVRQSRVPPAALSGASRKLLRPRGPLTARAFGSSAAAAGARASALGTLLSGINDGTLSAAPPRGPAKGPTLDNILDGITSQVPAWIRALIPYRFWLLLLVILLLILLVALAPGAATLAIAAVVLAAAIALYRRVVAAAAEAQAIESISPDGLTAAGAAAAPPNPSFNVIPLGTMPTPPGPGTADNAAAALFRQGAREFNAMLEVRAPAAPDRQRLDFQALQQTTIGALSPSLTFPGQLDRQVLVGSDSLTTYVAGRYVDAPAPPLDAPAPPAPPPLAPILAYPDIKQPMYKPLCDLSPDYFAPNLNLIEANTIGLMQTNPRFIEAYMVGVNHEFGRELLWREYPTDQRGTPFRQFWDASNVVNRDNLPPAAFAEQLRDIHPIHQWPAASQLGANNQRDPGGDGKQLILVIRGDLLKRYPNTIIYAQSARWSTRPGEVFRLALWDESGSALVSDPRDPHLSFPIYKAEIQPDLHFIGFNLKLEQVRGHARLAETAEAQATIPADQLGWFFVLQEVVGEPRFGLDDERPAAPSGGRVWDDLSWEDFDAGLPVLSTTRLPAPPFPTSADGLTWGANAADMASILYQKPVLVAYHARDMLKDVEP